MSARRIARRDFLRTSTALAAGSLATPYFFTSARAVRASANDRPLLGAIGVGGQGTGIAKNAMRFGDFVAVCDVDRNHAERGNGELGGKAELYEDYRALLDRDDIEAVTIGTPDHWHTAIAVYALRAGKDVYCEKPLTLTIDEGKLLVRTVQETGRILQVGTQQRSDGRFRQAAELVRNGRLGKLQNVTVSLPRSTQTGGPFAAQEPPANLNWDFWQGQTEEHHYFPERVHFTFRWWYEYSGGIMTDWGAHHMDIAQWAMDVEHSGPLSAEGHLSDEERQRISQADAFNTPAEFTVDMQYANDVHLQVVLGDEGVLFEGDQGRIYVNRGRITGKPVEDLADNPLPEDRQKVYESNDHMGNFFDCVKSREQPISDVVSQHRSVSACHIANISLRLGRKVEWNPAEEMFVGDDEANGMLARPQRSPYQFS